MLCFSAISFIVIGLVSGQQNGFVCPQANGNYPNPSDGTCRTYYQCSNYQVQTSTCPSNWKFHPYPTVRRCLLPDSVDCNDPNPFICPVVNGNVEDVKDCKRFYACQDSAPLHRTCPSSQIFDSKNQRCVDGDERQCGRNNDNFQCPQSDGLFPNINDKNCRSYFSCSNYQATRMECPNDFKFHPYPTMRRCLLPESVDCNDPNPFVCPTENANYADAKDCKRFYSCQNYAPLHRDCPIGQKFDDLLKRCEYGDTSQCGKNDGLFQCAQSSGLYPDKSDATCRNYYSCSNFQATRLSCSNDFKFHPHPDMRKCVVPDSLDCNDPNPFVCPRANEDFPDPRNCNRFYFCDKLAPLHRTCQRDEVFSNDKKRCLPGNTVTCVIGPEQYNCAQSNGNFADPSDSTCKSYFQCNNGRGVKNICSNGLVFHSHPNMSKCVLADSFDCNSPNPFVCPEANADLPDSLNCNRFYSCQNYVPLHRTCPAGDVFVDQLKSCRSGSTYKCLNFVCPIRNGKYDDPNDSTCRQYFECNAGKATRVTCPSDFKFHSYPTLRKCVLPDAVDCKVDQFVCVNANEDVPDPKNSNRFYSCQNSAPLHRTCPAGQVFKNNIKRCE